MWRIHLDGCALQNVLVIVVPVDHQGARHVFIGILEAISNFSALWPQVAYLDLALLSPSDHLAAVPVALGTDHAISWDQPGPVYRQPDCSLPIFRVAGLEFWRKNGISAMDKFRSDASGKHCCLSAV